jgi:hypothetical protein
MSQHPSSDQDVISIARTAGEVGVCGREDSLSADYDGDDYCFAQFLLFRWFAEGSRGWGVKLYQAQFFYNLRCDNAPVRARVDKAPVLDRRSGVRSGEPSVTGLHVAPDDTSDEKFGYRKTVVFAQGTIPVVIFHAIGAPFSFQLMMRTSLEEQCP